MIFASAKVQQILESFPFWTTFLLLNYVNPLIINNLQNHFGKLLKLQVFSFENY